MPIRILPARLANQIAAGEVVERPASVVKELVENSLDAGATRIDIDIEKGGSQLIRIRDNGCGIEKDELELALSRHATSKIHHLDDLEAITSLGFRGEALASVSSVSRLTLTSRPAHQSEAWSAIAEGRDMAVRLLPAAHPVGSTVEVADLFFNTPARRKFLRTDKTEFQHIDELLKRIALSREQVTFTLSHNGKSVRQYRAANNEVMQRRRLAAICGQAFAEQALQLSWQQAELSIHGWVGEPNIARAQPDVQYCYVNGRMMRDKVINHAIRQAYDGLLNAEQYPCYVLFIELSPHDVDVNVHPAKHEVRFHQARLVHDFIFQAVFEALREVKSQAQPLDLLPKQDQPEQPYYPHQAASVFAPKASASQVFVHKASETKTSQTAQSPQVRESASSYQASRSMSSSGSVKSAGFEGAKHPAGTSNQVVSALYQQLFSTPPHTAVREHEVAALVETSATAHQERRAISGQAHIAHDAPLGEPVAILAEGRVLLRSQSHWHLMNSQRAQQWAILAELYHGLAQGLKPQPLLIPMSLSLTQAQVESAQRNLSWLAQFGIGLECQSKQVIVQTVCQPLRHHPIEHWLPRLLTELASHSSVLDEATSQTILQHLVQQLAVPMPANMAQVVSLLSDLEQRWHRQLSQQSAAFLHSIDEQALIRFFEHDA
ncbi:DNA mismatch repair protein MutL [Vibrio stylophorae]|uniref:DNA mismatch repair protein MutL n=1 Tax=Vibrio stylophorae TaxID=659351 RepID=A0ABM8ZW80_9VIBR|nr:DNA mismatch repair endonuclease MutL [Vibrio stylophorae]CAH0534615.1 DNA mismatch repair protein MutL [Vibrio stylophorae]